MMDLFVTMAPHIVFNQTTYPFFRDDFDLFDFASMYRLTFA